MNPDQTSPHTPRLPIYILIDCSGSMIRLMPTVQSSLGKIVSVLKYDQRAAEPGGAGEAYISLIPFNDDAWQTPLTGLRDFQLPVLQALGKTQLGMALQKLNAALDHDLVPNQEQPDGSTQYGDYRPLVFLITDGAPSKPNPAHPEQVDWQPQARILRSRRSPRPLHIVALAIGPEADVAVLQQIADDNKVVMVTGDPEQLEQALMDYFDWMKDTVAATRDAYTTLHGTPPDYSLPPFPQTLTHAPGPEPKPESDT